MGKKNKKQSSLNGKTAETTQQKGGSAIVKGGKDKPKSPVVANQQKNNKKVGNPQSSLKNKKNTDLPKKVDEAKIKEAATNIAGKKKKKRNRNKGAANGESSPSPVAKKEAPVKGAKAPAKPAVGAENGQGDNVEKITDISKRIKNRCKSKIRKEIALKGKSKLGLADPKLVAKKLAKLKNKAEPHSLAAQRNIVMLEKLLKRLQKAEKKLHKGPKDASTAKSESEEEESLVDDDEDMEQDSDDSAEEGAKVKPVKPAKGAAAAKLNGKAAEGKKGKPKDDKFFLFIGNLPMDITDNMITEHFKSVGTLQKVKIPIPRRKKAKRFAYVQFADEPSRQKALELHGSQMGEKKITVLFADKSKGKSGLMSKNAKLNAKRKLALPTEAKKTQAKPKKNKIKNQKPKVK